MGPSQAEPGRLRVRSAGWTPSQRGRRRHGAVPEAASTTAHECHIKPLVVRGRLQRGEQLPALVDVGLDGLDLLGREVAEAPLGLEELAHRHRVLRPERDPPRRRGRTRRAGSSADSTASRAISVDWSVGYLQPGGQAPRTWRKRKPRHLGGPAPPSPGSPSASARIPAASVATYGIPCAAMIRAMSFFCPARGARGRRRRRPGALRRRAGLLHAGVHVRLVVVEDVDDVLVPLRGGRDAGEPDVAGRAVAAPHDHLRVLVAAQPQRGLDRRTPPPPRRRTASGGR